MEDWQINFKTIKDRVQYLLQSEKWADCRFLVGASPYQRLFSGHRFLMVMASPVFERMFYGCLPGENDPICITDVEPDTFKAMLDYIYTDEFSISSLVDACKLYYVAKKYMLPHVVERCTNFLLTDLTPKNACRVYEFAKLNEEPRLMESSMKYIASNTLEVIADPSFVNIEDSTLMAILDQGCLNINSELDLLNCLIKFTNECRILIDGDKDNTTDVGSENADVKMDDSSAAAASTSAGTCSSVPNVAEEVVVVDSSASASGNAGESAANTNTLMDAQRNTIDEAML